MEKKNLMFLQTFVSIFALSLSVVAKATPEEERTAAEKRFLENYKASLNNGPQTAENGLTISAYQHAKGFCPGYKSPISELEKELQGKLFFVQTLPGLSADGTLIATHQQKGVHIGEPRPYHLNDYVSSSGEKLSGKYTVASDWKSTNHFTINHLAPSNHYAERGNIDRPFVVILPVNQDPSRDILKTTISASFPEVVVLGDYALPPDSIILVRSDKRDQVPAYYREKGFEILEYEGVNAGSALEPIDRSKIKLDSTTEVFLDVLTGKSWVRRVKKKDDYAIKRDAIKKVIASHGGLTGGYDRR